MAALLAIFIVLCILLLIFLLTTLQQLCISNMDKDFFALKVAIFVSIFLELIVAIAHILSTSGDAAYIYIAYALFWFLMVSMTFVIYKLIQALQTHVKSKARKLNIFWLTTTMLHILWIIICFSIFIVTDNVVVTTVYDSGFYLYLLIAATISLIISYYLRTSIYESIGIITKQIRKGSVSQHQTVISPSPNVFENKMNFATIDYGSNNTPLDPMEALAKLHNARRINNIRICISIITALISGIKSLMCLLQVINDDVSTMTNGPFSQIDRLIIHYWLIIIFYVLPIINTWTRHKKIAVHSMSHMIQEKMHLALFHTDSNNPKEHLSRQNAVTDKKETEKKINSSIQLEENKKSNEVPPVNTTLQKQRTSNTPLDFDSYDLDDKKSNRSNLEISHAQKVSNSQKLDLCNNSTPNSYTKKDANRLSMNQAQISLNRIDSKGRTIGKRGAVKPKKMIPKDGPHSVAHIEDYLSKTDVIDTTKALERPITSLDPVEACKDDDINDMLDTINMSDEETLVSTVIFEFGSVLATNIDKVHNKSQHFVNTMSSVQKELCFGGADRVNMLKLFLQSLFSDSDRSIKCFIITDEKSKMVMQLLNDVGLLKYFVTRPSKNEFISHIVGWDKNMYVECNGKRHLILFKLLNMLRKAHSEMLYVGNDKDIIQHLEDIKACEVFYCATKGLTQNGIDAVQNNYFYDLNFVFVDDSV